MKPTWMITRYYPFLEDEIVAILDSIMNDAKDYNEFAYQLGRKVCDEDAPITLVYLAAIHAWRLENDAILRQIHSKYGDNEIIGVWTESSHIEAIEAAFEYIAENKTGKWMEVEMHILSTLPLEHQSLTRMKKSLDKAKTIVEADKNLRMYQQQLVGIESAIRRQEGDIETALNLYRMGLEMARENEDSLAESAFLISIGNLQSESNIREAWRSFDDAINIARDCGFQIIMAPALHEIGKLSMMMGEYDLAIMSLLESYDLEPPSGIPTGAISINLTRAFCAINDGTQALEWGKLSLEHLGPDEVWGLLANARPLILLDRLDEAAEYLALAHSVALKNGREWELAEYFFVNGLWHLADGDILNGMSELERAMEISERLRLQYFIGPCLIALTKAEIELYREGSSDTSGPWMSRLEDYAREKNLQGIMMEHALLKAEFQKSSGLVEAARNTLVNALVISDAPSVATLHTRIRTSIKDLERET